VGVVATTSFGRLFQFRTEGAAAENARLASSVRDLGTIRLGALRDEVSVNIQRKGRAVTDYRYQ